MVLAGFGAAERDEFATPVWPSFLGLFFCGFVRLAAIVSVPFVPSRPEGGLAGEFLYVLPPVRSLLCFALCKHPYSSVAALIVQYERR